MFLRLHERLRNKEEGFTLIELMVVVLIIAILIAIAIPTFLGARKRAQDRAAQSSLRNALTAAATIYTDAEDYGLATPAALLASEPALTFVAGTVASAGFKEVSVSASTTAPEVISLAALAKSGTCFWLKDVKVATAANATPGTFYGSGATCTGDAAAGAAGLSW